MATIFKRLSDREDKKTHRREILIRFKQGNKLDQRAKTNIFIDPAYWREVKEDTPLFDKEGRPILNKDGKQKTKVKTIEAKIFIKDRLQTTERIHHAEAQRRLATLEGLITDAFLAAPDKSDFPADWLESLVDKFSNPEKYEVKEEVRKQSLVEAFYEFLEKHKLSEVRKKNYKVIGRALQRFELYKNQTLDLDTITPETLRELEQFLRTEYILCEKHLSIYKAIPEARTPQPRGSNTINEIFTRLRTFIMWCNNAEDATTKKPKTTNNPFRKGGYKVEECAYGTPYYITIDERNQIYNTDLSHRPQLAIQRDIFVFQCLVGCRVGDLYKMTPNNVINGSIEYVPRKTKEGRPVTVQVPLNGTAKEILDRHKESSAEKLLPFISEQKYNAAIKEVFRESGITRNVTTRNPTTGDAEIRPINEVASSHLARRAFVGNLYKQVKDPNLVSALSGHKDGSKAFARYRAIDDDDKRELIGLLDAGKESNAKKELRALLKNSKDADIINLFTELLKKGGVE